jgi:hypothetical protein
MPYSVKAKAIDCAKYDVCGVAFNCDDYICILDQDEKLKPRETNFVFIENNESAVGSLVDEEPFISYPVVRLSEIRVNNTLVLKNCDEVTKRLRNTAYTSLQNVLESGVNNVNNVNNDYNNFNKLYYEVAVKIDNDIKELETLNNQYLIIPPVTDDDKIKFRLVQHNLKKRNQAADDLLRSMKRATEAHSKLVKFHEKMTKYNKFLEETRDDLFKIAQE